MSKNGIKKNYKSFSKKFSLFHSFLYTLGILIIISFVFWLFTSTQASQSDHVRIGNYENTELLQTFTDPSLPGFSMNYDSTTWKVTSETYMNCKVVTNCTDHYGKGITVQRIGYPQKKSNIENSEDINLLISFVSAADTERKLAARAENLCFSNTEIEDIGDGWYRAKYPHYSEEEANKLKSWNSYYYRHQDISQIDNKYCTVGGLSGYKQDPIGVTFKDEPMRFDITFYNSASPDMNNIADSLVRSMKFD